MQDLQPLTHNQYLDQEQLTNSFDKFWRQHQNYLYNRCLQWMEGHHANAEDVLAQVAVKVWDKWPNNLKKINNPQAWLTRLSYNLCVDTLRKLNRESNPLDNLEELINTEDESLAFHGFSPESVFYHNEMENYFNHVIDTLPPKLRSPFILFYYQEIPYQEIAHQLALSKDNVRKRIQQARELLQQPLNDYLTGLNARTFRTLSKPSQSVSFTFSKVTTPKSEPPSECSVETIIDYKVTATCLVSLSPTWYQLPYTMV
jgi:RNA polymerase sigma-70 factor (ECF subfamily)